VNISLDCVGEPSKLLRTKTRTPTTEPKKHGKSAKIAQETPQKTEKITHDLDLWPTPATQN